MVRDGHCRVRCGRTHTAFVSQTVLLTLVEPSVSVARSSVDFVYNFPITVRSPSMTGKAYGLRT